MSSCEQFPITFYGGKKGGGKSHIIRAREIVRRFKYPGSTGLIVRKTHPELLSNHIRKFFQEYPITRQWYNKQEKSITYPNGSITEFAHLQHADDVYNFQGREFDDMAVDEVTQHEWWVISTLLSSLRTTNKDIKPSMLLTGNPGGIGHQDIKRIFIDRLFNPDEDPNDYNFVPADVYDNKALLDADPNYIKRLKQLPEHLRRMYLDGDWNVFAGRSFSELKRDVHLINPIKLHPQSKYFAGYDWGYSHPFAFVLYAIQPNGEIYCVNYTKGHQLEAPQQAKLIKNIVGDMKINVYAGTDCWAKRGGPMIIEQLRDALPNLSFIKAYTDRVHGVAKIRELISYEFTETGKPTLRFFKNCEEVYDCFSAMQFDEKEPEDVLKVDANEWGQGGDDLYDAGRYGLVTYLRAPSESKPPPAQGKSLINEIEKLGRLRRQLNTW